MLITSVLIALAARAAEPSPYVVPATRCYREESFALDRRDGTQAIRLAGTFTAPVGGGSRPTVVMITGSGDHIRDQMISGVPMFGMIADFLARAGYNVVRTDARGFGESTIDGANLKPAQWMQLASADRYRDNQFLVDHLLTRTDVDRTGLVVLGHSEGAMIAAMLAANHPEIDLAVLLSDSTVRGSEVFARQRTDSAIRDGAPPEVAERLHGLLLELAALLNSDPHNDAAFDRLAKQFAEAQEPMAEPPFDRGFIDFHRTRSPWHIQFMSYDPWRDLRRITVPVLAVYGGRDDATPWKAHAPILVDAMAAAGNSDFSLHVLPDQDHFFLEHEGRRVDRHPFGKTRISNELRDLLITELAYSFEPRQPYCAG